MHESEHQARNKHQTQQLGCVFKGGLLGVGLLGLVWSTWSGLVYLGWFDLLGMVWCTWAGLVYWGVGHLPITSQQRATVLEDEVDDTSSPGITYTHTDIQTYEQTREHEYMQADKTRQDKTDKPNI